MSTNPLQPADESREMALAHLRNAPHVREFLDKCAACGLPVDERQQAHDEQCSFCQKFLAAFFPDHPV